MQGTPPLRCGRQLYHPRAGSPESVQLPRKTPRGESGAETHPCPSSVLLLLLLLLLLFFNNNPEKPKTKNINNNTLNNIIIPFFILFPFYGEFVLVTLICIVRIVVCPTLSCIL